MLDFYFMLKILSFSFFGNFVSGIQTPRNFCPWNPKSWALESEIQLKDSINLVPRSPTASVKQSEIWVRD